MVGWLLLYFVVVVFCYFFQVNDFYLLLCARAGLIVCWVVLSFVVLHFFYMRVICYCYCCCVVSVVVVFLWCESLKIIVRMFCARVRRGWFVVVRVVFYYFVFVYVSGYCCVCTPSCTRVSGWLVFCFRFVFCVCVCFFCMREWFFCT